MELSWFKGDHSSGDGPRVSQSVNYLFFPAVPAELIAAEEIVLLYTILTSDVLLACCKN